MFSRIIFVLLFISSFSVIGSAATITWDGSSSRAWNVTANWDLNRLPTSSDTAVVSLASGPIINSGVAAVANTIQIRSASGAAADVNGGTLTTSGSSARIDVGYDAGTTGTLNINSGTVTCGQYLYVGYSGTGTLNMNGGTLNITGTRFRIGYNGTGVGRVYLYGGTINCNGSSFSFSMGNSGTASMDITNGKLIINGDATSTVSGYITSGKIKAYGGAGTVLYDYNVTNAGKTTVTAAIIRTARNPEPASSATNVAFNKILDWTPGAGAVSHDVYLGTVFSDVNSVTRLVSDLNGDGIVNYKDVMYLTGYWLENPAGSEPYAAINDDSIVDFIDYAEFSQDWLQSAGPVFKGNHDVNNFNPGLLAFSTTYYWRVDEVNGLDTYRGTVWSFTTQSGKASNPIPAAGASNVATNSSLNWTAGPGATSHDVYFGTASSPAFQANQTAATFDPGTLAYSTTYYWRIDEVSALGTTQGTVWSFTTTAPPPPPSKAVSPNPGNSATGVSITATISWTAGSGTTSHDVYFGTSSPGTFQGNQTSATFNPGTLAYSKTYYWRIDEKNANGTTTGDVWAFTTAAAPPPPGQAANPNPANSATGIAVNAALSWTAGSGAISHDVYFGTTSSPVFQGNQTAATFDPGTLAYSKTYYWRIDEKNAIGTTTGNVWIFTTSGPPLPAKAANPNPANGAGNIGITSQLSWTAGADAVSHDVYFGTASPPVFQANQAAVTFDPGALVNSTTYYWRIDENNAYGTTTGDIWNFTTAPVSNGDTLVGTVMVGYQGWHNCPGDGTTLGWKHWSSSTSSFTASNCHVAMWPDMNDYTPAEKFLSGFAGSYYVYSSHNLTTVRRHFQWMQQAGIDGAYMQRFATEVTSETSQIGMHRNAVLDNCKDAANLYGRKYAVMYDLSGASVSTLPTNDWKYLVDTKNVTRDPDDHAYMHHNGKPVVAVWGIGFGRSYDSGTPALIDFLKNDPVYGGNTVMIGVNDNWRTNTGDTYLQQCLNLADIISPWMVGRYAMLNPTDYGGVDGRCTNNWIPDLDWCTSHNKEYLLVVFPGYSYSIADGSKPLNEMPRWGGDFLWRQFYKSIDAGVQMLYIAMFDEVDEGTAIYKVSNNPPPDLPFIVYREDLPGQGRNYVPAGAELPGDHYMWLTGQGGRMLRGEIPLSPTKPTR